MCVCVCVCVCVLELGDCWCLESFQLQNEARLPYFLNVHMLMGVKRWILVYETGDRQSFVTKEDTEGIAEMLDQTHLIL